MRDFIQWKYICTHFTLHIYHNMGGYGNYAKLGHNVCNLGIYIYVIYAYTTKHKGGWMQSV